MLSKGSDLATVRSLVPTVPKELIDQFVSCPMTGEAVNEARLAFKKALIERALGAKMGLHLGYFAEGAKPETSGNQRSGSMGKTVLTGTGKVRIDVPRDCEGSFTSVLIPSISTASRVLMTRLSRFTPAACRCSRSRHSCWKRMERRLAPISSAR